MTRTEISRTLNRAGFHTELSPLGILIEGKIIRHNDATGITLYNATKFRARDIWEFLQFLQAEGFPVGDRKTLSRSRKIEKHL